MSPSIKRPTIEGLPSPATRHAAGQDGAPAPAFDLDLKRSVQRHPKLAGATAAAVLFLIVAFGLTRAKSYQAESLTYIEPMASKVLNQSATQDGYDPGRYDSYIQQQTMTALRPDILATAIGKLPPFVWQHPGETMQSAVARLQSSLKVERVSTSYQLSIVLSDANAETAASVVNAVTNTYLEQGRKDEHAAIDQRLKLLEEERQRIQQNLNEARVEQASLGSVLGVANPTGLVGNQYDAQIAGVRSQIATAREARDAAAAQFGTLQGSGGTSSPALAAAAEEVILNDPGLSSLKTTISQRKAVLNTQMAGMLPANTVYQQDQAEIADLDRTLEKATNQLRQQTERRLQDKTRADLERTADIENRLNGELKRQTSTATNAAPKLQRATELAGDIDRLTTRYGVVDDVIRGLQLESNGPGSAHLSVAAVVPVSPEPSKRKLILLLALPLALMAGAGAAVLAHRADPHIYSPPDVEKVLGFLPIGVMPAREEVSARVVEEYTLRLAAGLQSAYRTSSAQSFVFAAASSTTEIGTFVRAIERVLGTLGFKALVLDASTVLNPGNRTPSTQRGLTMHRPSALVRTIDGVRQGFAAEEIERLKLKYDLVLIDAPALLSSAETEYLVRCTDATILIAESGVTVKSELYQSALLLQQLNVAGVGAVLLELHLKDATAAFRAAIAAVERMRRGRSEAAGELPGGGVEAVESPAEEETSDEIAERLRQMSPPASRPRAKVDVAPELRAAGVARPLAEEREAAANVVRESEAPVPAVVKLEQATAERDSEEVMLAERAGRNSGQVHIEERDQVRPWRELLKLRKEIASEPITLKPMDAIADLEHGSSEPEPVLYFEDRMRPRRVEQPPAPLVPEAAKEEAKPVDQTGAGPIREDAAKRDAVAVAWADEAAVADMPSPGEREPVQLLPLAEETPASSGTSISSSSVDPSVQQSASQDLAEGSASRDFANQEFTNQPGWHGLAAENDSIETLPLGEAPEKTGETEETQQEPRFKDAVSHPNEVEERFVSRGAVDAIVGSPTTYQAAPESAISLDGSELEIGDVDEGLAGIPLPERGAVAGPEALSSVAEPITPAPAEVYADLDPEISTTPLQRTQAAPKLEWFTLKFRGTSERVLRLVPGEDLPERIESAHTTLGEPSHSTKVEGDFQGRDGYAPAEPLIRHEVPANAPDATNALTEADYKHTGLLAKEAVCEPDASVFQPAEEALQASGNKATELSTIEQGITSPEGEGEGEAARLTEVGSQVGIPDIDLEVPGLETAALAVPEESFEAPVAVEASIQSEAAPVPREKLNRWAVEDHVPVAPGWTFQSEASQEPVLASTNLEEESIVLPAAISDEVWRPASSRLSPVRLMGELRSRSAGTTQFDTPQVTTRGWSRRSAAAPVEERLVPRAAGLTRRWEMLSRFDAVAKQGETTADEEHEVSAAAERGGS